MEARAEVDKADKQFGRSPLWMASYAGHANTVTSSQKGHQRTSSYVGNMGRLTRAFAEGEVFTLPRMQLKVS